MPSFPTYLQHVFQGKGVLVVFMWKISMEYRMSNQVAYLTVRTYCCLNLDNLKRKDSCERNPV